MQEIQIKTIDGNMYYYKSDKWVIDWNKDFIFLDDFKNGNAIRYIMQNVIKFQLVDVE